jgi:hypothetical protein
MPRRQHKAAVRYRHILVGWAAGPKEWRTGWGHLPLPASCSVLAPPVHPRRDFTGTSKALTNAEEWRTHAADLADENFWQVAPLTDPRPLWLSAGTEQFALYPPPHQVIHPILSTLKQVAR